MTITKFIFLIRACGKIEPCLFVAYFLIMSPAEVSYFHATKENNIFTHNMESIRIIRRKKIFRIRRVSQSNKIIVRGNIDVSWEKIWGILRSFMRVGSIIKNNGR